MSAGFGLSMIDRAVKEFHAARCSAGELRKVSNYFEQNGGLQCIYCGEASATCSPI
jgi:L-rhamnose isomerase